MKMNEVAIIDSVLTFEIVNLEQFSDTDVRTDLVQYVISYKNLQVFIQTPEDKTQRKKVSLTASSCSFQQS